LRRHQIGDTITDLPALGSVGESSVNNRGGEFHPDLTQPIDWLAAADRYEPGWRPGWMWVRHHRCCRYIEERLSVARDPATVARRAAIILNAEPGAPLLELDDGIRYDPTVEGRPVKCRNTACRRRWVAIPEDPYFDGTTRADGICLACVLLETRTDDATPVLEAVVVTRPRKPKAAPADVEAVES
jgi:hypothetical protein